MKQRKKLPMSRAQFEVVLAMQGLGLNVERESGYYYRLGRGEPGAELIKRVSPGWTGSIHDENIHRFFLYAAGPTRRVVISRLMRKFLSGRCTP